MGVLQRIQDRLLGNKKLEYVVRKYGPDFISTYGGGALLAVGTATVGGIGPYIAVPAAAGR